MPPDDDGRNFMNFKCKGVEAEMAILIDSKNLKIDHMLHNSHTWTTLSLQESHKATSQTLSLQ